MTISYSAVSKSTYFSSFGFCGLCIICISGFWNMVSEHERAVPLHFTAITNFKRNETPTIKMETTSNEILNVLAWSAAKSPQTEVTTHIIIIDLSIVNDINKQMNLGGVQHDSSITCF